MASHSSASQRAQDLRGPNTSPAQAREARARVIDTPSVQVVYSFMNGTDRGDQLRAHRGYDHRIRGDRWQALAWSFLLDTILINTYILQLRGESCWATHKTQTAWRDIITEGLLERYASTSTLRRRFRCGNEFLPMSQHNHVKTDNYGKCKGCQGFKVDDLITGSSQRGAPAKAAADLLQIAICTLGNCWQYFHQPIC
jgi:hypothetical protein